MIVKVQLSLFTTLDTNMKRERQALIYDKNRATLCVEAPVERFAGVTEAMGDRDRAFFEADVIEHLDPSCKRIHAATVLHRRDCTCSQEIIFGKLLPEQGW
jgi:hypothetical protein